MSVKVIVQVRAHDGTLPTVDIWGAANNISYGAEDEVLTVMQTDVHGMLRWKQYFCGQYAAWAVMPGGGEDYSLMPQDATPVPK